MKHQYFGDVNDYRKFGLLRAFASRLRVGVCWLLTADDDGGDGELRTYLSRPKKWRRYDPELYDALARLLQDGVNRRVCLAAQWDLIPRAKYFDLTLVDLAAARQEYFSGAWRQLDGCELVFLDPDNGIEVPSQPWGRRGSSKYVYWRELKAAFNLGHSVLVYQHYPRAPRDRFVPFLADRISEELACARVTAFKTPHVAFFLAQQPAHYPALHGVEEAVAASWPGQIEVWR